MHRRHLFGGSGPWRSLSGLAVVLALVLAVHVASVAGTDGAGNGTVGVQNASSAFVTAADFDGAILITLSMIVFFMQAGFAMLEAGSVEKELCVNILFKNMIDSSIVAVMFWLVGFGLAFGRPSNAFCGLGYFALHNMPSAEWPAVFFQFSFSTTAATIVSGAIAGRIRVSAYMIYVVVMSGVMHPLVAHWVWDSTGWLAASSPSTSLFGVGFFDFAGGGVVHMNGGAAALVACWFSGFRK